MMQVSKPLSVLILFFFSVHFLMAQQQLNINLLDHSDREASSYAGSWFYVDENGKEYALLGANDGVVIYSIEQSKLEEVAFIPGESTIWREITVIGNYAYVVVDAAESGMQIIDLSGLPETAPLITTYTESFTKGHTIQKDIFSDAPFVYVTGGNTVGVHIIDVSNPGAPVEVGKYYNNRAHDCHVRDNLLFLADISQSTVHIIDITNKNQPELIHVLDIPGGSAHSITTTTDKRNLIIACERSGVPARIYNIEDLESPFEVATYRSDEMATVHNPYVMGDFLYLAYYTEMLRILDITDPEVPVEVGHHDDYSERNSGYYGLWSACPYLPSGKIVGGDYERGLYLWDFNGAKAGRFYGEVVDANTGQPILNAKVRLDHSGKILETDLFGKFKSGVLPMDVGLDISAEGYYAQRLAFKVQENDQLHFVIELQRVPTGNGNTFEEITLHPNPFTENLFINGNITNPAIFRLFNSIGQLVFEEKNLTFPRELRFDQSGLPRGTYYYQIIDDQQFEYKTGSLVRY